MTASDYKLHDKDDPLPDHLAGSLATLHIDSKSRTVVGVEVHRLPTGKPLYMTGLLLKCDRCERWQELRPCAWEQISGQASALGWREDGDKSYCLVCAGN